MSYYSEFTYSILTWAIPVYSFIFLLLVLVRKYVLLKKIIGKSPIVSPPKNEFDITYYYFFLSIISFILFIFIFTFHPEHYGLFFPFPTVIFSEMMVSGVMSSIIGLIIIVKAQNDMRDSWRIGIDKLDQTELITNGLFKHSRNPIYLGLILSVFGLFLTLPSLFTLIYFILGVVVIHFHIKKEEKYLMQLHGPLYKAYFDSVARYL